MNTTFEKIYDVCKRINEIVTSTMGPKGRTVLISNLFNFPFLTKDGATVAKNITFEDASEQAITDIFKQASLKTSIEAGDGTTTTTLLAFSFIKYVLEHIDFSHEEKIPDILLSMERIRKEIESFLSEKSIPIKDINDIENIAKVSSNNDEETSKMIALAIDKIGVLGSILIEEGNSNETILDVIEGFKFNSGLVSNEFIENVSRNVTKIIDPLFCVCDHNITNPSSLASIGEITKRSGKPVVLIASDFSKETLAAIILAYLKKGIKIYPVRAPFYGEERERFLEDLSIFVGADLFKFLDGRLLEHISLSQLGSAKKAELNKFSTIIVDGASNEENILERIQIIENDLQNEVIEEKRKALLERKERLNGIIAIIKIGGNSQAEVIEKKFRVEDAVEAVKSSIEKGILPGGGTAFIYALKHIEKKCSKELAYPIFEKVLKEPILCLSRKSNVLGEQIISFIRGKKFGNGFDFRKNIFCNLLDSGIIDPTSVILSSLTNAISIASALLMCGNIIIYGGK